MYKRQTATSQILDGDKNAVAAAIAEVAGVDPSTVQVVVVEKDDGSLELVAYITLAGDAAADAAQSALSAASDTGSLATALAAAAPISYPAGMAAPVVSVPSEEELVSAAIAAAEQAADLAAEAAAAATIITHFSIWLPFVVIALFSISLQTGREIWVQVIRRK